MTTLTLFDIDGTLLLSGRVARLAMIEAAADLFGNGLVWDGVDSKGGLDPLIFEEAARHSGIEVGPEEHAQFRDLYVRHLKILIDADPMIVRVLPGIPELIDGLHRRDDVVLGLLTGNYGPSAAVKLACGGLEFDWFQVTAFGDEAPSRPALLPLALERYRELFGESIDTRQVVVIGDTPRDVHCARENGARAFGVATGSFSVDDLMKAGAERVVTNLSDPAPLYSFINGGA